jgi:hypothetical protein
MTCAREEEGRGQSTSASVISGRSVYDAVRLRPNADLEAGVQDKGGWDTHEVQSDVRVHGQGDPEREVDRGDSPGDGHGGRHQTCAIGRGPGCQERRFSSHAKIPLEPSRVGAHARTSQREPRGVVDLHHHRTAISCKEGRGTGVSRQYLVVFRARATHREGNKTSRGTAPRRSGFGGLDAPARMPAISNVRERSERGSPSCRSFHARSRRDGEWPPKARDICHGSFLRPRRGFATGHLFGKAREWPPSRRRGPPDSRARSTARRSLGAAMDAFKVRIPSRRRSHRRRSPPAAFD